MLPADSTSPKFTVCGAAGVWVGRILGSSITLLKVRLNSQITTVVLLLSCNRLEISLIKWIQLWKKHLSIVGRILGFRFFRYDKKKFKKAAALGFNAPLWGWCPHPPQEIMDPPLHTLMEGKVVPQVRTRPIPYFIFLNNFLNLLRIRTCKIGDTPPYL